jgi:hypothetical protein
VGISSADFLRPPTPFSLRDLHTGFESFQCFFELVILQPPATKHVEELVQGFVELNWAVRLHVSAQESKSEFLT